MEAKLTCWDGREIALPDIKYWKFQYGRGTPCDSFLVTCLWEPVGEDLLAEAVTFTAGEGGETVFTGVVDECERGWSGDGGFLTLSGRSMAARLLDNEALGMEYQVATWQDIVRDHAAPYGIETLPGASLPAVPGFVVETGSSEWQVVYQFCRYYGGVTPRFDRLGRLTAAPWQQRQVSIREDGAITALTLRDQRYGVLSQVLVRDRTTQAVQTVEDADFARRGGLCRRVLTMPGKSTFQAMRYSGQYQLARAREELRQLELELPGSFLAWPGDLVELATSRGTGNGLWQVAEMSCVCDEAGRRTSLVLGVPQALL